MKLVFRVMVLLVGGMILMLSALPTLAHEGRDLGEDITVYFGWRVEPAVTNVLNGPEIFIEPENLTAELQVEVTFGPESITLMLEPAWEDPGHYIADLIPTMPGDYSFRVFGTIGDTTVDEVFTSADGEFSTVEPATDIMFPQTGISDVAALVERINALEVRIAELEAASGS